MRPDLQTLLRGLVKFVAVVVVAGLVGAGVGIVLAKLSGNDAGETPTFPATASSTIADAAPTTGTQPLSTSTSGTETAADVRVLSALLGPRSRSTGRALAATRVRLTNTAARLLVVDGPALLSGRNEVRPKASASGAATSFPRLLAPGASLTRTLRFVLPADVARRLTGQPAARLRIAKRTVDLKLTKTSRR